jgi:hypothetical protein
LATEVLALQAAAKGIDRNLKFIRSICGGLLGGSQIAMSPAFSRMNGEFANQMPNAISGSPDEGCADQHDFDARSDGRLRCARQLALRRA